MTRNELYDVVWQRPMVHVAKDFGLSDVGLRKICKKHDIPTPPLGYWAKLAHGKPVKRPPLPKRSADARDEIHLVEARLPDAPDEVIQALSVAQAREQLPENKIVAPNSKPRSLHEVAATIEKSLRKTDVDGRGLLRLGNVYFPTIHVGPSSVERAVILIDTIARALDHRGGSIELRKDDIELTFDGEVFELKLYETTTQRHHVPTRDELKRQAERDEWRKTYPSTYSDWQVYRKWDYEPSGRLTIELSDPSAYRWREDHIVGRWRDRKAQRLEDQLGDIFVALAGGSVTIKLRRQEEFDRLIAEAEEEDRLRTEEARRKREKLRRQFLFKAAHEYRRYRALVALQDHLEAQTCQNGDEPIDKMARVLRSLVVELGGQFERDQLNDQIVARQLIADEDAL